MTPLPTLLEKARDQAATRPREPLDVEGLEGLRRAVADVLEEQGPLLAKLVADGAVSAGEREAVTDAVARVARYYEVALGFNPPGPLTAAHGTILAALELQGRALTAALDGALGDAREISEAATARLETAGNPGAAPTAPAASPAFVHDAAEQVYDRTTGRSRYDARASAELTFQLRCPRESCARTAAHPLSASQSTHRVTCPSCGAEYSVYVATVVEAKTEPETNYVLHAVRTRDLDGTGRSLRFHEAAAAPGMPIAPRDLLVITYDEDNRLRLVRNYSRGLEVWVAPRARCFVATAALGPFAPEVETLRALRDEVLVHHALGRAFVAVYGVVGPPAAALVAASPRRRRATGHLVRLLARGTAALRRRSPT